MVALDQKVSRSVHPARFYSHIYQRGAISTETVKNNVHVTVTPEEQLGINQCQTELSAGEPQHLNCKSFNVCGNRCGTESLSCKQQRSL